MDINKYSLKNKIQNKNFITLKDYNPEEIFEVLSLAKLLKLKRYAKEKFDKFKGYDIAVYLDEFLYTDFLSIRASIKELFCNGINLSLSNFSLDELSIKLLSSFDFKALFLSWKNFDYLANLATLSPFPIICDSTSSSSPYQALSDLFTIWEHLGKLKDVRVSYIGKGSPLLNSLLVGINKVEAILNFSTPICQIDPGFIKHAEKYGDIISSENISSCIKDANVIFTDDFNIPELKNIDDKTILLSTCPYLCKDLSPLVISQIENRVHIGKALLSLLL